MRRSIVAAPAALLLTGLLAGTAFATHCGIESKKLDAGQHAVILVDPVSEGFTPLAGFTPTGRFTGGFVDVYIDFDQSGTISAGDLKIEDTMILSLHGNRTAPGQDEEGLAVLPPIIRAADPAGAARGAGFASVSFVP